MGAYRSLLFVLAFIVLPAQVFATPSRGIDVDSQAPTKQRVVRPDAALVHEAQGPVIPQVPAPQKPAAQKPAQPVPPPAPPPLPAQKPLTYYVERNGKPFGPLTLKQITAEIKAGRVTRNTLAWKTGDPSWTPAGQLPSLKQAFGAAPPRLPASLKWQHFILGTWRFTLQNPEGLQNVVENVTTTYRPDGTYTGVTQTRMGYNPPVSMSTRGKWSVQALGNGDKFTLTMTNVGSVRGQTATLRRINHNLVANDTQGYQARRVSGY